ncbi:MAG: hypothetical protein V3T99_03575 [Nitrososphaerales archaeon]
MPSLPGMGFYLHLARDLTGQSKLPLYELDQANVLSKRGRIRPFENRRGFTGDPKCSPSGQPPSYLRIRAWRLAHAIRKADCAKRVPFWLLRRGSLGFMIEHGHVFRWNADNLRLGNGMSDFYADFSRTSLSGRIAQGMVYLFMEDRGYAFGERFSTFLMRMEGRPGYDPSWRTQRARLRGLAKSPKVPDFIFEKPSRETALAESKGSFVSPGMTPNQKGDLRIGIEQLNEWDQHVNPVPRKRFAIGTYLREEGDPSLEPSMVAYVDPENYQPADLPEYPRDWVRRGNYAAWLGGMGFVGVAQDLQHGRDRSEQQFLRFPVMRIDGQEFAFVVQYIRPKIGPEEQFPVSDSEFWRRLSEWSLLSSFWDGMVLGIMGIGLPVMNQIAEALRTGESAALLDIEAMEEPEFPQKVEDVKADGSVFSDGTIVGELTFRTWRPAEWRLEEVLL